MDIKTNKGPTRWKPSRVSCRFFFYSIKKDAHEDTLPRPAHQTRPPSPRSSKRKINKIARKTTASGGGKKGGICERKKERCASNSDSLLRGENGIERIDYILLVQDNVKTTKAKGMDGKIMTRKWPQRRERKKWWTACIHLPPARMKETKTLFLLHVSCTLDTSRERFNVYTFVAQKRAYTEFSQCRFMVCVGAVFNEMMSASITSPFLPLLVWRLRI